MPELVHLLSSGLRQRVRELEGELAAARDKIRQLEAKLETDPLLNILNRRGFERELKRALVYANRYRTSVAVMFVALDSLKSVCESHGRLAGDAVLLAGSAAIVREHRASDIIARYGEDEFAVLLWNLSEIDARAKALTIERLIADLQIHFSGETIVTGASAGVTMLKRFDDADNVVARAEADMAARHQQRLRGGETPHSGVPGHQAA